MNVSGVTPQKRKHEHAHKHKLPNKGDHQLDNKIDDHDKLDKILRMQDEIFKFFTVDELLNMPTRRKILAGLSAFFLTLHNLTKYKFRQGHTTFTDYTCKASWSTPKSLL